MTFPEPLVFLQLRGSCARDRRDPRTQQGVSHSKIPESLKLIRKIKPRIHFETGYFIADASFRSRPPAPRPDTKGPSAAQTHQLCRVPEPGAQAAEFPGSFPGRGQGAPREREDAAAGPASPAGRAVVPWAEQPLAAGRGAGLGSEATADLERERDLSALGETNRHIPGPKFR